MIRIPRRPLPPRAGARLSVLTAELVASVEPDPVAHAMRRWRSNRRTATYRDMLATLQEMALGINRCMYCGDNEGSAVDHFEPVARNHLRTFDWLNHLLACEHCNSKFKLDHFPVDGEGAPLLIDPTCDDPFDHLRLATAAGEYRPRTPKGVETIRVCGLNRPALVRARAAARLVVEALLREWARGADPEAALRAIREQPFADVCQAMLRQAGSPGAREVYAADIVDLLLDPRVRVNLLQ